MSKPTPLSEGRQFIERRSKAFFHLARRMFAEAVELDPLYARAYAGIADCDSFLFLHYHVENVAIEDILNTSAKALALEGGLAEAHASRGLALSVGNDTKKRNRIRTRPSRSIRIRSRVITSMAAPVSPRANWSRQPHFSNVSPKSNPTTTSH